MGQNAKSDPQAKALYDFTVQIGPIAVREYRTAKNMRAGLADAQRRGNARVATQHDAASVLFADIVSFTPMAASLSPRQLVDLLNEVFQGFDGLVEKYDLEKIKTIGDCYMVAAGVPRADPTTLSQ